VVRVGIVTSGLEATVVNVPGPDPTQAVAALPSADGLSLFVALLLGLTASVPLIAGLLRRRLPVRPDSTRALEPVSFGSSQRAHRSPRHAVLLHRGLMGAVFMALVALFLVPAAAALGTLGARVIPAAIAFALPMLLVTLHARRRSTRG